MDNKDNLINGIEDVIKSIQGLMTQLVYQLEKLRECEQK